MFESLSRSWSFATDSFRILRDNKRLLILPIFSCIAALLVAGSFLLPLMATGQADHYLALLDEDSTAQLQPVDYVIGFAFYFCNYFVIIFFNAALVACTTQALDGKEISLGYGIGVAATRIPQIAGWALISAVIGLLLRMAERSNKRVTGFIMGILGMAWTALTFFVLPSIVIEGTGPIASIKRSAGTLKQTWGTALMGNFSMGLLGFLLMLPLILLAVGLIYLAATSGSVAAIVMAITVGVALIALGAAAVSAADVIFKVLLFSYATGKTLPENINTNPYEQAFTTKS